MMIYITNLQAGTNICILKMKATAKSREDYMHVSPFNTKKLRYSTFIKCVIIGISVSNCHKPGKLNHAVCLTFIMD